MINATSYGWLSLCCATLLGVVWGDRHAVAAEQAGAAQIAPVKVLSYRPAEVIEPLLARFTRETGVPTALDVRRGEGGVEYFLTPREGPPADVILLVDAQRLDALAEKGVLRSLPPQAMRHVPETWRDPGGLWAGMGWRVRAVLQAQDGPYVGYRELLAELGEGKRVCVREGDHVYNRGLSAWLKQREGEDFARMWAARVHDKREPIPGGDRDQITAMANGLCDFAVVNHYYFARMAAEAEDAGLRERLARLRFGPAPEHGAQPLYGNVSGVAVTRASANPRGADRLAGWLMSPENQAAYAEAVWEFPTAWPNGGAALAEKLRPLAHMRASVPGLTGQGPGPSSVPFIDSDIDRHARAWIRDIDAGNPDAAWEASSALLQQSMARNDWQKAVKPLAAFGAVEMRVPTSVAFSIKLPGMPDGQYAVVNYDTRFVGKAKTVESVILRREADGYWRGVGYRVQ